MLCSTLEGGKKAEVMKLSCIRRAQHVPAPLIIHYLIDPPSLARVACRGNIFASG